MIEKESDKIRKNSDDLKKNINKMKDDGDIQRNYILYSQFQMLSEIACQLADIKEFFASHFTR